MILCGVATWSRSLCLPVRMTQLMEPRRFRLVCAFGQAMQQTAQGLRGRRRASRNGGGQGSSNAALRGRQRRTLAHVPAGHAESLLEPQRRHSIVVVGEEFTDRLVAGAPVKRDGASVVAPDF